MPKMIFVNLPVADVEKSAAFYEAIGFNKDARFSRPGAAAAMVWSDTIVLHDPEPRAFRRIYLEADRRCEARGRDAALPIDRQP